MVAYQTKIRISKHEIRNSKFRKAFNKNNAVFKGAKYLLLKNRNNIRLRKHREQLNQLLEVNKVINTVMILKDQPLVRIGEVFK